MTNLTPLFKTTYSTVLALTTDSVQISDQTSILDAITAYNLLSVDAKTGLQSEKDLLDQLLVKIGLLVIIQDEIITFNTNSIPQIWMK